MSVSEQQRTPGLHEVDISVPVDVDQFGTLASLGEHRCAPTGAERPDGGVDATGDHARARGRRVL